MRQTTPNARSTAASQAERHLRKELVRCDCGGVVCGCVVGAQGMKKEAWVFEKNSNPPPSAKQVREGGRPAANSNGPNHHAIFVHRLLS